ncbi:molybdate transport system substrate-binding protein [Pseudonocardia hierapolitana]|uniref:Molybdate transport system substrate-binding protein n=1 Tax=Pseudonocardia hierapolitana TaxID=1128676 RepID=A0A561ST84_9PSEU|nr:molybdate ABC transporter substrate-binding protein [Pseudonocardia hierapolitana]TWF78059.1 molybdate transport system substrate-binding protein [Pseudonocardia hierapolitana]
MRLRTASAVALAVLLAGCGGAGGGGSSGPQQPEQRTLTVFAAASLTEVFSELEPRFEEVHPGVDVVFNFGASSDLAQQIVNGGPADLFAAANTSTMTTVSDAGLVDGEPTVFATNVLEIVTPPGNPAGIASFADLARPDLKVVVCAPQVPCGAAAEKIEQTTGVTLIPVSEEPDVKSTLGKVTTGNADAGLVYATDVRAAGDDVQGVGFPEAAQAVNDYPIAVIADAPNADLARAFQELVTGAEGRAVLGSAGFGSP